MVNAFDNLTRQRAFDHYYGCGAERSYEKTAQHIQVTTTTIKNWAKKDNWQLRVQQRDMENARLMEQRTNELVTDVKADYRKIVKAGIGEWVKRFKAGEIEIRTARDLETLVKLDMLLMGEPEERREITGGVTFIEVLENRREADDGAQAGQDKP
jgi:transposase